MHANTCELILIHVSCLVYMYWGKQHHMVGMSLYILPVKVLRTSCMCVCVCTETINACGGIPYQGGESYTPTKLLMEHCCNNHSQHLLRQSYRLRSFSNLHILGQKKMISEISSFQGL